MTSQAPRSVFLFPHKHAPNRANRPKYRRRRVRDVTNSLPHKGYISSLYSSAFRVPVFDGSTGSARGNAYLPHRAFAGCGVLSLACNVCGHVGRRSNEGADGLHAHREQYLFCAAPADEDRLRLKCVSSRRVPSGGHLHVCDISATHPWANQTLTTYTRRAGMPGTCCSTCEVSDGIGRKDSSSQNLLSKLTHGSSSCCLQQSHSSFTPWRWMHAYRLFASCPPRSSTGPGGALYSTIPFRPF